MFSKCANGSCPQAFHYSRGSVVFRVETPPDYQAGEGRRSRISQVEYYWLCAECLHIILVSMGDHGAARKPFATKAGQNVSLTSLDTALRDMERTETLDTDRLNEMRQNPGKKDGFLEHFEVGAREEDFPGGVLRMV